jgi:hypothetical protein
MKTLLALSVVGLLVSCGYYPVPGPQGVKGDPGLQGPASACAAIVWRNSVGTVIAIGQPPMHKDGNGDWWFVDTDTGNVDVGKQPTSNVVYPSTNCTGPSFYQGPIVGPQSNRPPFYPPRIPFFVNHENQWRVREENVKTQIINLQGFLQQDGTCSSGSLLNYPTIPTGPVSTRTTALPDLGSTGPLHMETFQD